MMGAVVVYNGRLGGTFLWWSQALRVATRRIFFHPGILYWVATHYPQKRTPRFVGHPKAHRSHRAAGALRISRRLHGSQTKMGRPLLWSPRTNQQSLSDHPGAYQRHLMCSGKSKLLPDSHDYLCLPCLNHLNQRKAMTKQQKNIKELPTTTIQNHKTPSKTLSKPKHPPKTSTHKTPKKNKWLVVFPFGELWMASLKRAKSATSCALKASLETDAFARVVGDRFLKTDVSGYLWRPKWYQSPKKGSLCTNPFFLSHVRKQARLMACTIDESIRGLCAINLKALMVCFHLLCGDF